MDDVVVVDGALAGNVAQHEGGVVFACLTPLNVSKSAVSTTMEWYPHDGLVKRRLHEVVPGRRHQYWRGRAERPPAPPIAWHWAQAGCGRALRPARIAALPVSSTRRATAAASTLRSVQITGGAHRRNEFLHLALGVGESCGIRRGFIAAPGAFGSRAPGTANDAFGLLGGVYGEGLAFERGGQRGHGRLLLQHRVDERIHFVEIGAGDENGRQGRGGVRGRQGNERAERLHARGPVRSRSAGAPGFRRHPARAGR